MEGNIGPFSTKFARFVVDHPNICILFSIILISLLIPGVAFFREKHDVRSWLRETDPKIKELDKFERQFGNDENVIVAIYAPEGVFSPEAMKVIREVTDKMWLIPKITRVDSVCNYNYTHALGDDLVVEEFIPKGQEENKRFLLERKDVALRHRVIPDYLINRQADFAMIFASLVPVFDNRDPGFNEIVKATRDMVARYQGIPGVSFYIGGTAVVTDAFREVSHDDNKVIIPAILVFLIIYLFYLFRSTATSFLPHLVILPSIVVTFGLGFYLGMSYTAVSSVVPAILFACSTGEAIHIIVSYYQHRSFGCNYKEATFKSIERNFVPTAFTTFTTMIGLFSNVTAELVPIRELSILATFGVFCAWLLTLFLMTPVLVYLPLPLPRIFQNINYEGGITDFSKKWVAIIDRYKIPIIIFFTFISIGGLVLGFFIKINSNPRTYFSESTAIKQAFNFIQQKFPGCVDLEMVFESGKADGIKDPAFLRKIEQFKEWIKGDPRVYKTFDVIDIVKEINQSLNGGDPRYYKIPDSEREISEGLFLYSIELPQGMDLNNRITIDNASTRMTILWSVLGSEEFINSAHYFEEKAEEFGLSVYVTGKFYLYQRMMTYIVKNLISSVFMSFGLISLSMMLTFRSVKIGLIALIPNVLPLFVSAGLMKLLDWDLNVGNAMVASVCLGIAMDDTVHFLIHYHRLKEEGWGDRENIAHIFSHTGKALIMTTVVLATDFSLLLLGDFIPNQNFGILCAVTLTVALFFDIIFMPAVLFLTSDISKRRAKI